MSQFRITEVNYNAVDSAIDISVTVEGKTTYWWGEIISLWLISPRGEVIYCKGELAYPSIAFKKTFSVTVHELGEYVVLASPEGGLLEDACKGPIPYDNYYDKYSFTIKRKSDGEIVVTESTNYLPYIVAGILALGALGMMKK